MRTGPPGASELCSSRSCTTNYGRPAVLGCCHPWPASGPTFAPSTGSRTRSLRRATLVECSRSSGETHATDLGRRSTLSRQLVGKQWPDVGARPGMWGGRTGRRPNIAVRSAGEEVLLPLGLDFLTFLAATVLVIPIFKSVKASPVLGFLFSGLILGQLG